jgi:hypothetical protein
MSDLAAGHPEKTLRREYSWKKLFSRGVNHFFGEPEVNPPRTPDGLDLNDDYRHCGGR